MLEDNEDPLDTRINTVWQLILYGIYILTLMRRLQCLFFVCRRVAPRIEKKRQGGGG